ncbi:unnamed protein product [Lymnaea stagnalis]|uniref:Ubiquitin-like-conjugating enzyme ATG10 n=1 Tax=Lymnaea stagnalis TaxID=6523 RepID=A0AAV2HWR3_LYMST
MTTGSISFDEFRSLVEKFVDTSNKIDDKWHLESGLDTLYMCKKCTITQIDVSLPKGSQYIFKTPAVNKMLPTFPQSLSVPQLPTGVQITTFTQDSEDDISLSEMELEDEDDISCMPAGEMNNPLTYEYHILYSESYCVPVLYFIVFRADGKLLSLEEVWKLCPSSYQKLLTENKWATLTQMEHPILGRPYLQLHPCHTADLMTQIMSHSKHYNKKNYLVTWLSTVGPLVGLQISPSYMIS